MNIADPFARDHFTYGAGRRACPGVHVAERSLFINVSRVLWGFALGRQIDADGKAVPVNTKMVPGFFSIPEPFACEIRPRSGKHGEVMRRAFEAAEKEGLDFGY